MVYAGIFPEAQQGGWVSQCTDFNKEGFWDLQQAARSIICLGGRVEVILRAFHVLYVRDSGLAVSPATLLLGGCRPRSYIRLDEQSDLEAAWFLNAKCVVSPWDRLGCLVFAMKLGLYTGAWISSDVFSPQSNAYSILRVENPIVLSYIIPAFVK